MRPATSPVRPMPEGRCALGKPEWLEIAEALFLCLRVRLSSKGNADRTDRHQDRAGDHQPMWKLHRICLYFFALTMRRRGVAWMSWQAFSGPEGAANVLLSPFIIFSSPSAPPRLATPSISKAGKCNTQRVSSRLYGRHCSSQRHGYFRRRSVGEQKLPEPLVLSGSPSIAVVCCAIFAHLFAFSPISTKRRIASGRDSGAFCFIIQASIGSISAGGMRTSTATALPGGRPMRFFPILETVGVAMA